MQSYPQIPVTFTCNNTSPFSGLKIGASTILILWSAVTCKLGFRASFISSTVNEAPSSSVPQHGETVNFEASFGDSVFGGAGIASTNDGAIEINQVRAAGARETSVCERGLHRCAMQLHMTKFSKIICPWYTQLNRVYRCSSCRALYLGWWVDLWWQEEPPRKESRGTRRIMANTNGTREPWILASSRLSFGVSVYSYFPPLASFQSYLTHQ